MIKMTQREFADWKRDMRNQMQWINAAFERKDWEYLDELANQLSASALNLHSEARVEAK